MVDRQAELETGIIRRLFRDADFGFIEPSGAYSPVFFHAKRLAPGVLFADLHVGQQVEFRRSYGPKGPRADGVLPVAE